MTMIPETVLGRWKINECMSAVLPNVTPVPVTVEGAIFTLNENGELIWELPSTVDLKCPIFECDCFEVVCSFVGTYIQMGAVSGHIFKFYVDRPPTRESMKLTFEGWCTLTCVQVEIKTKPLDFPFSFLPAFQQGFFSDQILTSSASVGKDGMAKKEQLKFDLHSVILELSGTKLEDLSALPEDILETFLFFLYAQCLPSTLTLDMAGRCVSAASPRMNQFKKMCEDYIYRINLRNRLMHLVNDVHKCADEMLLAFQHHKITKPGKFCQTIKLALRHASVAIVKLVEICGLYGEEASKLHRDEKIEILRYAKTRLPLVLNQFVALLRIVKSDFTSLKPSDRTAIAASIVIEVDSTLETLSNFMTKAAEACAGIETRWATKTSCFHEFRTYTSSRGHDEANLDGSAVAYVSQAAQTSDFIGSLFSIFRERELQWLHNASTQIQAFNVYISQRKEIFDEMVPPSKIRCVSRNLEQLMEELPVFLLRLEEIMVALDDRFQWKDFRFCLQQAISQVFHAIHHLRQERKTLQGCFSAVIEMVQSDAFYTSLANLTLIELEEEPDKQPVSTSQEQWEPAKQPVSTSKEQWEHSDLTETESHVIKSPQWKDRAESMHSITPPVIDFTLVNTLCTPPKSEISILANKAAALFNSTDHSDMVFEVRHESETVEIPSHRVIVASRCDWFRRALLSGMKESVQKRIVIHDCPIHVFRSFLRYVYTGKLGADSFLSTECLCDLTALADRYEVDELKLCCEHELIQRHLDENSVVFLLTVADQFNAQGLRRSCLQYIASNPGVMAKDVFEELTPELQMEVYDITMWSKANRKVFSTVDELVPYPRYMLVPDTHSSSSDNESYSTSPS